VFERRPIDSYRLNGTAALELARGAHRLLIKVGSEIVRVDRARNPLTEDQARAYLVHDDGLMRVPVLVCDDLLVRGFTEELYREALDGGAAANGETA
jgi:arsenate reductase-like glutaredoxin family protein